MGIFDDSKDLLSKLGGSLAETGQELKRMADQATEKSQLQSELGRNEKELESHIYNVGLFMVSNEPDICKDKCPELYEQIVNARETSKMIRDKLALIDVEVVCPGCGKVSKGGAQFCINCGSKLPETNLDLNNDSDVQPVDVPEAPPAIDLCPKCGAKLKPDAIFCTNCGEKIGEEQLETVSAEE